MNNSYGPHQSVCLHYPGISLVWLYHRSYQFLLWGFSGWIHFLRVNTNATSQLFWSTQLKTTGTLWSGSAAVSLSAQRSPKIAGARILRQKKQNPVHNAQKKHSGRSRAVHCSIPPHSLSSPAPRGFKLLFETEHGAVCTGVEPVQPTPRLNSESWDPAHRVCTQHANKNSEHFLCQLNCGYAQKSEINKFNIISNRYKFTGWLYRKSQAVTED